MLWVQSVHEDRLAAEKPGEESLFIYLVTVDNFVDEELDVFSIDIVFGPIKLAQEC